jgi:hypothetical protein
VADPLDVTGSVPDIISVTLSLSEAMSAAAGFSMTSVVFPVKAPPKPAQSPPPASARSTKPATQNRTSAASPPLSVPDPELLYGGPPFFKVQEKHGFNASDRIRIGLRVLSVDDFFLCAPMLQFLDGFDTEIGDQIAIELSATGPRADGSVILSTFGFINPVGFGFGRFWASTLVRVEGRNVVTSPVGKLTVTAPGISIEGTAYDTGHLLLY